MKNKCDFILIIYKTFFSIFIYISSATFPTPRLSYLCLKNKKVFSYSWNGFVWRKFSEFWDILGIWNLM